MALSHRYNIIGNYWDRGGNEIDIVAINETEKIAEFVEVKLNPGKLDKNILMAKAKKLEEQLKGFSFSYSLLSADDM